MAKSSTSFNESNQPEERTPRGKSAKTIILEALREESLMGLNENSTKDESEKAFFKHVAQRAVNPDDSNSGMCLNLLANKGWANLKPSNERVIFDFDKDSLPHIQASQVMLAASEGVIPPDIANTFIQSIKAMIDIEEYTNRGS